MKVTSSAVLLSSIKVGDLFYTAHKSVRLAMRVEEAGNDHPYIFYFDGQDPFRLVNAENMLNDVVRSAVDLECRPDEGAPIPTVGDLQDVSPGALVFKEGRYAITVAHPRGINIAFNAATGKQMDHMTNWSPFASWKLVRRVDRPIDHEFAEVFAYPSQSK